MLAATPRGRPCKTLKRQRGLLRAILFYYWAMKRVNVGSSGRDIVGVGVNYLYNSI